ncbi:Oligo-1,6-glucosidase [bioreactor metagenome]|uniref:Oligo-1,6-glucosidase n=1 Tax=bioreactor metagenome TaxID=1076179 RepID=A0A645J663_9ZZZZ
MHFYRRLLRLRAENRTLIYGDFAMIEREHPQVFAYTRSLGYETFTVLCNMSAEPAKLESDYSGECVLRNLEGDGRADALAPYEARVLKTCR